MDCCILLEELCDILIYPDTIFHTPGWLCFKQLDNFQVQVCWYQRKQCRFSSQRIVIVCFNLIYGSLKDWLKCLLLFCLSHNFPRTAVAPRTLSVKKKNLSKYIRCFCLAQKVLVGVRNITKSLGKKRLGKEIFGE